jgi:Tfp pilus assembly protein PilW
VIGLVIVTAPISWYFDERKRARKKAEESASASVIAHTEKPKAA